jgi:hypothetical protein
MNIKKLLKEFINRELDEELEKQEQLVSHIKEKLSSLEKDEESGVISVTPSNKSDMALVVRFDDKDEIESGRKKVKAALKGGGLTLKDRMIPKYDSSTECTEASYSDGSGRVYIVYKYDIGSREGLALEHVVGFLLTRKITDQLKNRLDLPPEAQKEEVIHRLKTDYVDVLEVGLKGKELIQNKVGKVIDAESLGSQNAKADLVVTVQGGKKYGLSIKLVTEEGRGVRFTYNKNLGYGNEKDDNIVKNPSGKPWWIVGRQSFAKKLGRSYKPGEEDFEPPSWMTKAKESKPDVYKEAMEDVYAQIRQVLVNNLRSMKLKELVDMVNEAHLGAEDEREGYEELLKLTSDVDGVKLVEQSYEKPDINAIKSGGMDKSDLVKEDGAKIIIEIPGMTELVINSVKFHSNMLSAKRDDLKIKTR